MTTAETYSLLSLLVFVSFIDAAVNCKLQHSFFFFCFKSWFMSKLYVVVVPLQMFYTSCNVPLVKLPHFPQRKTSSSVFFFLLLPLFLGRRWSHLYSSHTSEEFGWVNMFADMIGEHDNEKFKDSPFRYKPNKISPVWSNLCS